jgi:hypothetical protein
MVNHNAGEWACDDDHRSPAAPFLGRLDRPGVEDCRRRPPLAALGAPLVTAQLDVEPIQRAVLLPGAEVPVHAVPGGKSCGSARHWQPVRAMYRRAATISWRSYLAGRTPGFGAGIKRPTWDHCRSLG